MNETIMTEKSNNRLIRRDRLRRRRQYDSYKWVLLVGTFYLALFLQPNNNANTTRRCLSHHHNDTAGDFSDHSCESIYQFPQEECAFARTCNSGDGIFLANLIYCHEDQPVDHMSSRTILWLLSAPLSLILILLFRILGSTAEEFFSPGLELFSIQLGLPERFAGVTLLALGNGAPDVASTVNAIRNDHKRGYLLALGELTGAGMVASTLIVGAVAFVSPKPVPCRAALVRDVLMFIVTMGLVYSAFDDGTIDPKASRSSFIGLYLAYVLIVLMADIYHRRQQHLEHEHSTTETESPSPPATENTPLNTTTEDADEHTMEAPSSVRFLQRVSGLVTNYDHHHHEREQLVPNGDTAGIDFNPPQPPNSQTSIGSSGWGELDSETGDEPLMVFHPHHGGIVNLKKEHEHNALMPEGPWWEVKSEFTTYFQEFFDSIYAPASGYNRMDQFLMTCELPFTIVRMFTIPVPCDGYYCRPLLALSVALSPTWLCYYFYDQFEVSIWDQPIPIIIAVFALPLAVGLLILRFAPRGTTPPQALAAAPITMIGFVVSATLLDYIGDKLVTLLTFFGIVCHIPSTIMGLTVLAWGNASQDFIANITVAKKDLATMAITASFAGPVFNSLIGLGISFATLGTSKPMTVHLDNPLRVGFLFSVLNGILMIVSGIFVGKGFIPQKYGYVAIVVYFVYVVVSLTVPR